MPPPSEPTMQLKEEREDKETMQLNDGKEEKETMQPIDKKEDKETMQPADKREDEETNNNSEDKATAQTNESCDEVYTLELLNGDVFTFSTVTDVANYMKSDPQNVTNLYDWMHDLYNNQLKQQLLGKIERLKKELEQCKRDNEAIKQRIHDLQDTTTSLLQQRQQLRDAANSNSTGHGSTSSTDSTAPEPDDMRAEDATPVFSGKNENWLHLKACIYQNMCSAAHLFTTPSERMGYVIDCCNDDAFLLFADYINHDNSVAIPGKPDADWLDLVDLLEVSYDDPTACFSD